MRTEPTYPSIASCCCNSVSFALSMLCLKFVHSFHLTRSYQLFFSCQQGVGTGTNGDNGIDAGTLISFQTITSYISSCSAGAGAYQGYLGSCAPNVNQR